MNNNTNVILEAVGELDNDILENAFKKKRKKPIALIVIAAAAALSLLVGAAYVSDYKVRVGVDGEWVFDISTKPHFEAMIPSIGELTEMGATDFSYWGDKRENYTYYISAKPSEIITKYNLKPIINDNFLEKVTIDDIPEGTDLYNICHKFEEDYNKLLPGTEVAVRSDVLYFGYFLVDKQSGIPVYIQSHYYIKNIPSIFDGFAHFSGDHDYKIVDLNSGEKAIIYAGDATHILFGYDNVSYMMFTEADIDEAVQILKDLEIIDE